jgi:hypothetical protein
MPLMMSRGMPGGAVFPLGENREGERRVLTVRTHGLPTAIIGNNRCLVLPRGRANPANLQLPLKQGTEVAIHQSVSLTCHDHRHTCTAAVMVVVECARRIGPGIWWGPSCRWRCVRWLILVTASPQLV